MRRVSRGFAAFAALALVGTAGAYPLDDFGGTGIARLEALRLAQEGLLQARLLPFGAQWSSEEVVLRLADRPAFDLPESDLALRQELLALLGGDADAYGVALLDLTDPAAPRYAGHRDGALQNPGSVGKILVALGWFQALADRFPDDVEARRRFLRETEITADAFISSDRHVVPFWSPGEESLTRRPLRQGDRANLYTFLDWMCSASSNAAAAMLQKHLLLLLHFGERYPVSSAEAEAFFAKTPAAERGALLARALQEPVRRNGLDLAALRQGSFFSRLGKQRVPGTTSHASARELLRYLLRLEQGRLVDAWSSREIKKLLYLTDRRIRYASHPALFDAAFFFKSGSWYSCRPEPGFTCAKYSGNVRNFMNSAAIVETRPEEGGLRYLVVVLSNVLRKNSAVEHQTLGLRIHRMLEKRHPWEGSSGLSDPLEPLPVPGAAFSEEDPEDEAFEGEAPQ